MKYSKNVASVLKMLEDNSFKGYIVGGAVRDYLLARPIMDYDISTDALPDDLLRIFGEYKLSLKGINHGTVGVSFEKEVIEVTTFRKEYDYNDNRHPSKVEFITDIYFDLQRRDFTINALAYKDDVILDYFDGIKDLHERKIKCIGDSNIRFQEDALRILRALRLSCQLEFSIEEDVEKAILSNYKLLKSVSLERINEELLKMIDTKLFPSVFKKYYDVFNYIYNFKFSSKEVFLLLDNSINDSIIRLAILFSEKIEDVKFYFSRKIVKQLNDINDILKEKMFSVIDYQKLLVKYEKSIIERSIFIDNYMKNTYNQIDDNIKILIQASKKCHSLRQLAINGDDLKELGVEQKKIGEVLNHILIVVIEEKLNNQKEDIISYIKYNMEKMYVK